MASLLLCDEMPERCGQVLDLSLVFGGERTPRNAGEDVRTRRERAGAKRREVDLAEAPGQEARDLLRVHVARDARGLGPLGKLTGSRRRTSPVSGDVRNIWTTARKNAGDASRIAMPASNAAIPLARNEWPAAGMARALELA